MRERGGGAHRSIILHRGETLTLPLVPLNPLRQPGPAPAPHTNRRKFFALPDPSSKKRLPDGAECKNDRSDAVIGISCSSYFGCDDAHGSFNEHRGLQMSESGIDQLLSNMPSPFPFETLSSRMVSSD